MAQTNIDKFAYYIIFARIKYNTESKMGSATMTESREKTAFKKQVLKVSIYCNNETLNLHEQKTE